MRCPQCEWDNRDGRRFCSRCGAALPRVCGACGFANGPSDRFCGGCGQSLAGDGGAEPAARAPGAESTTGERRQVTMLFADLSGFTRLTSDLGAEQTHRLLSRYLSTLGDLVGSYGGRVEYIGDAVMALFGAPVAHGDDPVRAVRAAGEMHLAMGPLSAELGRPLQVHIGIASGEVVAAGLGDSEAKYTVIGDSVNLASRLSDLARAGETLISEALRRALDNQVRCEPAGEVAVKGFDRPLRVWRIADYAAAAHLPQFDTPFVGRQAELRQFAGILEACRETRCGQTVLLRGEAGIGKTRLAAEFALAAAGRGFVCHKGLVLDFGAGKGQDAIGALTRSLLGIPPGAGKQVRAQQAEAAVADGLIDAGQRAFLNDLLDLPQPVEQRGLFDAMDAAMRQRGREAVLDSLVRRSAARAPVLLLVEDIHWADPATLGMLASLARSVGECPAVLALTSWIDGDPVDVGWRAQAGHGALTIIDLGPLRAQEAQALAAGLVVKNAGLIAHCIERAEGNPLFLEQLLRNSEESASATMPGSILSLVLARMDRLSAVDKHALQAAAVIGQRFTLEALRALVRDERYDPAALLRHRLIRPEADGVLFSHSLIRDGVYGSLLSDRRHDLHRRAAAYFNRRDAVLKAQHLDLAEDPAAPIAYLDAARALAAGYDNARALQLGKRGLELARTPEDRTALALLRGTLLLDLGSATEAATCFRQVLEDAPDDAGRGRAWYGLAASMRILDRFSEAFEHAAKAEAIASQLGLKDELARIHHLRGNLCFPQGRLDECLDQHQRALGFAKEIGSVEAEARALGGLGDGEYARGRMLTAHDDYRRCVELARRHGLGRIEVANMSMLAYTHLYLGDVKATLDLALEAVSAAAKVGHQRAEIIAREAAYECLFNLADFAGAREQIMRSLALSRRLGAKRFESEDLTFLARLDIEEGKLEDASRRIGEALAISRQIGVTYIGPCILAVMARITPSPEHRRQALEEAESILGAGTIGHNYLWYYQEVIDSALATSQYADATRWIAAFEEYFRREPSPWSRFIVARGRALVAFGQGRRDPELIEELHGLREEGDRMGFRIAMRAIDQALGGIDCAARASQT